MATVVKFNGTFDDFELRGKQSSSILRVPLSDISGNVKPLNSWLVRKKDVVVKGDDFVRNYHLIYAGRSKDGKFRMDYINE